MSNKFTHKLLVLLSILVVALGLTGCMKPYDVPEFLTVEASQTAYLIPLVGDTSDQGSFGSEALLEESKVATKEVQIPHRWVQTGRHSSTGEWRASAKLIIVERKPETREWTQSTDTGTTSVNQGIVAESKESIAFTAQMNCSAQIDEENATKFLYRYNNKTLAAVMDTEIRAMVESYFVEECSMRAMEDILLQKQEIMTNVRARVETFFADRGITVTVLGLKGDLTYSDAKIQEAINSKFTATKSAEAQSITNKTNIEKAEADKAVKISNAEAEAKSVSIIQQQLSANPAYIDYVLASKWNGSMPTYYGGGESMIMDITK